VNYSTSAKTLKTRLDTTLYDYGTISWADSVFNLNFTLDDIDDVFSMIFIPEYFGSVSQFGLTHPQCVILGSESMT
jgi:hypothetical protein